jgi:predicted dehydrogenase
MRTDEAHEIVAVAQRTGAICAVNFGYSGYPLVRHMGAMVAHGDLGRIRLIKAEFANGFHGDASQADNPRMRWRYDPAAAGISSVFADAGIHALHMACFVTGQQVAELSAAVSSANAGGKWVDARP